MWLISGGDIYTSIYFLYPLNPIQGHGRGGVLGRTYLSCHRARGRVHPGQVISPSQSHKRDTQPCVLTFTPRDNLETPVNLTCRFLDGGRKLEWPGKTCKLHTERPQSGFEP